MENMIKEELDIKGEIPADYKVPYFVHQDDMNKLDMSHKRVEKWLFVLLFVIFTALIGSNVGWMIYESRFEDVVTETYTAETDQGGTAIANGDGTVTVNGESNLHEDN